MGRVLPWLVPVCLAPSLSGCVFYYMIGVALMPQPRIVSIDVAWSKDEAACRAAFEGEPGELEFVGLETSHRTKASGLSFAERENGVWLLPTDDPSFEILDGFGRAVFDFDNDGALDLAYIRDDAIFVAPATRAMRDAFESGRKPEATLIGLGFRVLHRFTLDAAEAVAIQRVNDVTYLLATRPDGQRPQPNAPRYQPLIPTHEPDFFGRREMDLYRIGAVGTARKVCTFQVVRGFPA